MMRRAFVAVLALLTLAGCEVPPVEQPGAPVAVERLDVVVDLSEQKLTATRTHADGSQEGWITPVSTGRPGYETRTGSFHPTFLDSDHKSTLYEDAPMPWSVFFHGNEAIHGTYAQTLLGRPVSHGCVRVHTAFAERLFAMVLEVGKANTIITVQQ